MIATGSLLVSLVLAATQVQAQQGGLANSLSSGCQTAATNLVKSDFASCSNVIGLLSVVEASGSIVSPLNTWINSVCTSNTCSSSTLSSAEATISSGCSSDISSGNALAIALNTLITDYTQVMNLLCLRAISNSSYCITDTLNNIQTTTGTNLTVLELTNFIAGGTSSLVSTLSSVPSSAYCTDCGHAMFTEASAITANASTSASSTASSAIASKCGSSFVDGKIPSTVDEANAAPSASASKSAAGRVEVVERGSLVGIVCVLGALVAGAAVLA